MKTMEIEISQLNVIGHFFLNNTDGLSYYCFVFSLVDHDDGNGRQK